MATKEAKPKEHSLSNTVAGRLGCPAAVLLKYLDYVVRKKGKEKDGHKWYRVTLDHLAVVYPYLGRTCIEETLQKLTDGDQSPLLVHHRNYHGYDRTGNYAIRDRQLGAQSRTNLRYFRADDALSHGIPAALLLHNLRYWASRNDAADDGWQAVKVGELAKVLPLTTKQIRDALKSLVATGMLERTAPAGKHRCWRYRLAEPKPAQVTIPDTTVTKADMQVTNPDMEVTKADNYNSYQSQSAVGVSQSINYSVRPAPPSAMGACQTHSAEVEQEASSTTFNAEQRQTAPVTRSDRQTALVVPVDDGKPQLACSDATAISPVEATTSTELAVPKPSTLWPPTIKELQTLAWIKFSKVEKEAKANLELLVEQELDLLVKSESIEALDRYSQMLKLEILYTALQPLVSTLQFDAVMDRDASVLNALKQLAMMFLVDAFRYFDSQHRHGAGQQYSYRIHLDMLRKLQPLRKARIEKHRQQFAAAKRAEWEARRQQHRSPDESLEGDAALSAAKKVKVLENAINARNLTGVLDDKYQLHANLLNFNANSLFNAKEFFNTNADVTPAHLLEVMDVCAAYVANNPLEDGEYDENYELRKGTHLTSLLNSLPTIVAASGLGQSIRALIGVNTAIEEEE
ncbi:MAG: hypothetical protein FD161_3572 [Limisphaerales bacterium]|nr:MAG: hypothetical protein FD161_3572 [Limisphaerales bacterium]KAG0507627.1 MAG: hypothetical protein E1N63_3238 [Limisphaerales bacterium]TXT48196.1 MAG: hypothetical protein FD140_3708 [Limisphaerales bacterium]